MAGGGVIRGQMILDVSQALSAYTAVRLAHLSTMTAMAAGSSALMAASAGIAGIGAVLAVGIGVAVNAAAEFERKLDYFTAVSASTQAEYEAIRVKALELGKDTIYSAGQIADSFVELGKAGVSAKDIIGGIGEGVAALGAAADIPLDTSAKIIMSAVQTFQLGAGEAVSVADKLAGAANASIIDVQDLGVSLKYAGGVASSLGMSFDDVNTALALLGQYGIKGSTAGTSLRQILVSLTGTTKKASNQLKDLGIITEDGKNKFFDSEGSAKSLAEIFEVLGAATRDMSDEQRLAAYKSIFQSRALSSVIALTNEGAAGFDTMAEAIGKTTAMDVANERLDNLSGDLEILRGNLETLAIESGSQLQEFARSVVQGLTKLVQWFSNLSVGTQAWIIKAVAITSVVLLLVGLFGMFAASVINIILLFTRLVDLFRLVRAVMVAVRVAVLAQNAAWLANPIVLIIVAIIAVIALLVAAFVYLWKNNEGFRKFFIGMWDGIKAATSAVVDWFKGIPDWFADIWDSVQTKTSSVWNAIVDFFKSIPGLILKAFLNFTLVGQLIKNWEAIKDGAVTAFTKVVDFVKGVPQQIGDFFVALPGRLGYLIGFTVGTIIRFFADMAFQVKMTLTNWFNNTISFFEQLPGRVIGFLTAFKDQAILSISEMVLNTIAWIVNMRDQIITTMAELPGKIINFFLDMYNGIQDKCIELGIMVRAKAEEIFWSFVNWIAGIPGKVSEFFQSTKDTAKAKLDSMLEDAKKMGTDVFWGLVNGIAGLPDKAEEIFDKVVGAVKGAITSAFNAVKDFASGMWEGFKDGLGIHSPSYIEEAMWTITGVVETETQRLAGQVHTMQGLGNNITELGQNMGLGFNDNMSDGLTNLALQVKSAQDFQNRLASMGSTVALGGYNVNAPGATNPLNSLADSLANSPTSKGPQTVINQDITQINPIAERDSEGINRSLQLGAFMMN